MDKTEGKGTGHTFKSLEECLREERDKLQERVIALEGEVGYLIEEVSRYKSGIKAREGKTEALLKEKDGEIERLKYEKEILTDTMPSQYKVLAEENLTLRQKVEELEEHKIRALIQYAKQQNEKLELCTECHMKGFPCFKHTIVGNQVHIKGERSCPNCGGNGEIAEGESTEERYGGITLHRCSKCNGTGEVEG